MKNKFSYILIVIVLFFGVISSLVSVYGFSESFAWYIGSILEVWGWASTAIAVVASAGLAASFAGIVVAYFRRWGKRKLLTW